MRARDIFGALVLAFTGGVAQAQAADATSMTTDQDISGLQVSDPFEDVNRGLFTLHTVVDNLLLEPAALGYRYVVPGPARTGVRNVLRNINSPVVFVNGVLQGSPSKAGTTAARFGINTTIGVVGVFDVANHLGLKHRNEDFGQTLGVWGVGEGPYVFVPILGPTNVRDGVGRIVDVAFDPLNYAQYDGDDAVNVSRAVLAGLDAREQLIGPINDIEAQSADPYATMKRVYTANRRNDIKDGAIDVQALPDFDSSVEPSEAPPIADAAPASGTGAPR